MNLLPEPSKPLKILTLDGGGLQAISTLLILNKLLDTIAAKNGVQHQKPRPCDVFDTIAGVGTGGWLAILLGRFHMDISSCLTEWYSIVQCITPRSRLETLRLSALHRKFNTHRLVAQIDRLAEIYGQGDRMFTEYDPSNGPRCIHVFVAASKTTSGSEPDYNLFRSYVCPAGAKVRDGPKNPSEFKISHAFAATGATKYFTPPWLEKMEHGETRFSDKNFPNPHNITDLALDEMRGIYGEMVPISAIVNIGPGLPSDTDVKQIAKRFSWGLDSADNSSQPPFRAPRSLMKAKGSPNSNTFTEREGKSVLSRKRTLSPDISKSIHVELERREDKIEQDIVKKLQNSPGDRPEAIPQYYRLALNQCPPGTAKNDVCAPKRVSDATREYLKDASVTASMEKLNLLYT